MSTGENDLNWYMGHSWTNGWSDEDDYWEDYRDAKHADEADRKAELYDLEYPIHSQLYDQTIELFNKIKRKVHKC